MTEEFDPEKYKANLENNTFTSEPEGLTETEIAELNYGNNKS